MAIERLGNKVVSITDSMEALSTFQEEPDLFDIVATDHTMPKMTGIELAKEIKKLRPVPVILCTGFCDNKHKQGKNRDYWHLCSVNETLYCRRTGRITS